MKKKSKESFDVKDDSVHEEDDNSSNSKANGFAKKEKGAGSHLRKVVLHPLTEEEEDQGRHDNVFVVSKVDRIEYAYAVYHILPTIPNESKSYRR
ncbi:hypothetical protein Tco_0870400 [Tanacetum coccineum]